MLFDSYVFLFAFLPVVFGGFFFLGNVNRRAAATFLVFASLCFYGWLDARFVALLLLSIAFNFTLGRLIAARPIAANSLLVFAVTGNLVVLGVFKYADFFIDVANRSGASLPLLHIVLPLGISFFTFTQIAFLVDVKDALHKSA